MCNKRKYWKTEIAIIMQIKNQVINYKNNT